MTNDAVCAGTSDSAKRREWLTTGRFAIILGALIFVAYPQVVTGFHSFVWRDYGLFGYPFAHYHKECFWRGEIPLWNPFNNYGIPYLAQWGTMVLYPPSLIYLLLPLPWSLGIFTLLHQLLGGVGMFVLALRLTRNPVAAGVAGVAFAFNGFMVNCLMWPSCVASMGWMPWVLLTVMQAVKQGGRNILVAALVGAIQMLSGTPEVILLTWLLVAGVWLVKKHDSRRERWVGGLRFAAIVALVAVLAAAQLLPFLELLQNSNRSSTFDNGRWSLPATGWANLLVPVFRMGRTGAGVYFQEEQRWASSYYVGVAVLVAGLLALGWTRNRKVWFLFAATLLAFIYALGENTPIYGWLRTAIPATGFMRFPSKMVIVVAFTLPLLAAYGLAAFMSSTDERLHRRRSYMAGAVVAVAVLTIAGIIVCAHWVPHKGLPARPVLLNGAMRAAFLLAIVTGCWLLTLARAGKRHALLQVCLLIVMYFDFITHSAQQNPTVDREALTVAIPWLKHMRPRPTLGESRAALSFTAIDRYLRADTSSLTDKYIAQRNGLYSNLNLIEGMPKADGFYALYVAQERDIYFRLYETNGQPRPALGRFLGFSQVTSPANIVVWNARTNYLPLVTAGQLPIFTNSEATLEALISTNFQPEQIVYLPPDATNRVYVTTPGAVRITARNVTTHKVSVEVSASAPSLVVIAQTHYPRWKAFVDGQPAALLRANHAFQAVQVPPGEHRVDVIYRDKPFQIGAVLSLFSVAAVGIGCAFSSRSWTRVALNRDSTMALATADAPIERYVAPNAQ